MKKILLLLSLSLLFSSSLYAVDTEVQDLADITTPVAGDDMYIVDDPDVTPLSRKINISALLGVGTDLEDGGALSANTVDSSELVDGGVDLSHMSVNSIDSDQYIDASIDLAHMSSASVDSDNIVNDTIANIDMADNSVDSAEYVDNSIDEPHVNFGTGAGQVSLDDIPEGTTRYYINNSFNGTFKEEFDATVASDGVTVTMSIQATDGGDLTEQFSSGLTTFDTTPAATIALTAGTDPSPQGNWIYILQSAPGTLVKSTSTWPTTEHIRIAFFFVQSATGVQTTGGAMVNQNWNNSLTSNADSMGESTHIAERMRINSARYFSGVDGNGTDNYLTPTAGNVEFISTSGVVFQVHSHTFPVINTSTGSELRVKNWSGDAFHSLTNLYDIVDDSTGTTITNNKFFNLVFWGVANKTGEHQSVMINLPGGTYNTQSGAEGDGLGFDDFEMPREFTLDSSTGFLIARMTIQMKTGGGTWVISSTVDLRKSNPQQANGGASSLVTSFADNTFDIFDNTDNTKIMVFDVGTSITTGTTRTYTSPDADGTLALTSQSDGTIVLTTNTTGSYAAGDAEAGNALTGDSATSFFSSGTIEHERGGLEADVSAFGAGLYGQSAGFATIDVDTEAELETALGGINVIVETEIDLFAELNAIVADEDIVGTSTTNTLINKTVDADNNTISNIGSAEITNDSIVNEDINSAAAISGSKIVDATTSVEGSVELATTVEIDAGTGVLALSVAEFEDSGFAKKSVSLLLNQGTALTQGDGKIFFRLPDELAGWSITNANAACAVSTGTQTYDIFNVTQGTDTLTTAITIEASDIDSLDSPTQRVINTAEDDATLGDRYRIDATTVGGSDTTFAEVQITFERLP